MEPESNLESVEAIMIRRAEPADMDRVVRQWLNSYRNSKWAGVVPNDLYKRVYSESVRQLLARGAQILVACSPTQPSLLLGFICHEVTPRDLICHFVFVRSDYRRAGVATELLKAAGIGKGMPFVYTFRTSDSSYLKGGTYLPDLARRKAAYKPAEPASAEETN